MTVNEVLGRKTSADEGVSGSVLETPIETLLGTQRDSVSTSQGRTRSANGDLPQLNVYSHDSLPAPITIIYKPIIRERQRRCGRQAPCLWSMHRGQKKYNPTRVSTGHRSVPLSVSVRSWWIDFGRIWAFPVMRSNSLSLVFAPWSAIFGTSICPVTVLFCH